MIKLYEILEDANTDEGVYSSHEDANYYTVGITNIKKVIVKGPSNISKSMHVYSILTDADYENNNFYDGRICIIRYKDKTGSTELNNIRKDALITITNITDKDGKCELEILTKSILDNVKEQDIEFNYQKIDSQKDNLNYPSNIFISNLSENSVKIKFDNMVNSQVNGFLVAYRKADESNTVWNYVFTDKTELELSGIEHTDYFIKVMYLGDNDFSFFSNEILFNFY